MLQEFSDACEKMLACMQLAVEAEAEKRRVLLDRDAAAVDSLLQEQQAMTMRLESLEKKRLAAQEKAGLAGLKPEQILAKHSERRAELTELFRNMHNAADQLQELNKASMDIARTELRLLGAIQAEEGLYAPGGHKAEDSGNAFNEKI